VPVIVVSTLLREILRCRFTKIVSLRLNGSKIGLYQERTDDFGLGETGGTLRVKE